MKLNEIKINQPVIIKNLNIENNKLKMRLGELGLFEKSEIIIKKYSPLKQTIILQIFNSLFALKTNIAKMIEVEEIKR